MNSKYFACKKLIQRINKKHFSQKISAIPNHLSGLLTSKQIQTVEMQSGMDGFFLMQKAGRAAYETLITYWPWLLKRGHLLVFCGSGNNAGDGYVLATCALAAGIKVTVIALKHPDALHGAAHRAYEQFKKNKGVWSIWHAEHVIEGDVIVDALLGTGLTGTVTPCYQEVIRKIVNVRKPVLSIDLPSGLCADTGCALGAAVQAHVTVALVALKCGHMTGDGLQYCGQLILNTLDVSHLEIERIQPSACLINECSLVPCLKERCVNGHKGNFGQRLVDWRRLWHGRCHFNGRRSGIGFRGRGG